MSTCGGVTVAYEEERTRSYNGLTKRRGRVTVELRGWVETWERRNVFALGELNGRVKINLSRSTEPNFLIGISGFHI